jgi:bifunctional non-homologous end joining protein LigD
MQTIDSISLYFQEGGSDKEYHIQLVDTGDGYIVNFQYGRRGSNLTSGTKTTTPVPLDKAQKVFASLKREKMGKGYIPVEPGPSGSPEPTPFIPKDKTVYILPQLLNPILDAQPFIGDDSYIAQEKKDGERRMIIADITSGVVKGLNKKGQEVPVSKEIEDSIKNNCILDGEIVGRTLFVFDILSLEKRDLMSLPCIERIEILNSLNFGDFVKVVETVYTAQEKQELLDKLKSERREGIVFKHKQAPYTVGRPASGGTQVKFKFYKTATFIVVNATKDKRSVGLELIDNATQERVFMGKVTIPPNYDVPEVGELVEVRYLYAYKGGAVYQPIYLGKRPDSDLTDATMVQIIYKADFKKGGNISDTLVYHGTDKVFKSFDKKKLGSSYGSTPSNKLGFFFTDNTLVAKTYGKIVKAYRLNVKSPYVIDAKGKGYSEFKHNLNKIADEIDLKKYDSIIIKNYADAGVYSTDTIISNNYIVFDAKQIVPANIVGGEVKSEFKYTIGGL